MRTLFTDLAYGLRQLRMSPGFALVAILTLALGIGAITAMFSAVNGVLLTELPYPDADRLVLVRVAAANRESLPSVSAEEVVDFRERIDAFDSFATVRDGSATLSGNGEPEQIQIGDITWNFLSVLGIQPALGRDFNADDAAPGTIVPVVISHGLWQRGFGGDADIVGKVIQLDGNGTTVIGVLPPEAQLLLPREAGLPRPLRLAAVQLRLSKRRPLPLDARHRTPRARCDPRPGPGGNGQPGP